MLARPPVVRDLDAEHHLEAFLVSTVASIVVIRVALQLAGWPQFGGGGLHIAHLVWGGLLLAVALLTLLSTVNSHVKGPVAVLGGIGFGTFIDELGKFITSDNDYFFQPTFAIIYVVLMVIFFTWRWANRRVAPTDSEYLVNAVAKMQDAVLGDFDEDERHIAQGYLQRCDVADPRVWAATVWLANLETVPPQPPSWYARTKRLGRTVIDRLLARRGFVAAVVTTFVVVTLVHGIAPLVALVMHSPPDASAAGHVDASRMRVGQFLSSLVAALFVLYGVIRLPISRISAYRQFRSSLLVSLLVTQFFRFYERQLVALGWLAVDLLLLFAIGQLIERDRVAGRDSVPVDHSHGDLAP